MAPKTVIEHIRDHLLGKPHEALDLEELARTEWSSEFERYMRNRMIMGAFRYGRLHNPDAPHWDIIGSVIARAEKYRNDGNKEHLVDVANLCLVEFVRPCGHPDPRWGPVDDGEHLQRQEPVLTVATGALKAEMDKVDILTARVQTLETLLRRGINLRGTNPCRVADWFDDVNAVLPKGETR
jgi:hypothetical protein